MIQVCKQCTEYVSPFLKKKQVMKARMVLCTAYQCSAAGIVT